MMSEPKETHSEVKRHHPTSGAKHGPTQKFDDYDLHKVKKKPLPFPVSRQASYR